MWIHSTSCGCITLEILDSEIKDYYIFKEHSSYIK